MVISGMSSVGAGTSMGAMGMNQTSDPVSKDLLRQIDEAKKKLQELSFDDNMSMEEKMKKRQELQKQISDLNSQLRQRKIELRQEAMENAKKETNQDSGKEEPAGKGQKTGSAKGNQQSAGLSKGSMQAMISAEGSMKQAKVQGSVAKRMEGKAGVLEAEIKLDSGRGGSVERKKEELAEVKNKAEKAAASQMDTLAKASKTIEKAQETDENAAKSQTEKSEENLKAPGEKEDSKEKAERLEERTFVRYKPVDILL